MAQIEKAKGRRENQSPSAYTRLFGIDALGNLISRVQAAVITAGTELEKLIYERSQHITDLDAFIAQYRQHPQKGLWVANKQLVKKWKKFNSEYEPDFLAFDPTNGKCYIIEVKDGDTFDTKKAAGEHLTLHSFASDLAQAIPFATKTCLCAFNARSVDEIYEGLKGKFGKDELLTGKQLCDLLEIDFEDIIFTRAADQAKNLEYFIKQLLDIPAVRKIAQKLFEEEK